MTFSDPIADMFTRIRNALKAGHESTKMPFSSLKLDVVKILKEEGFVKYYEVQDEDGGKKKNVKVGLKYDSDKFPVIKTIKKISKPGCRVYVQKSEIPKVLKGFGISIVSTSKGVLSGREARLNNVGGELLGIIY